MDIPKTRKLQIWLVVKLNFIFLFAYFWDPYIFWGIVSNLHCFVYKYLRKIYRHTRWKLMLPSILASLMFLTIWILLILKVEELHCCFGERKGFDRYKISTAILTWCELVDCRLENTVQRTTNLQETLDRKGCFGSLVWVYRIDIMTTLLLIILYSFFFCSYVRQSLAFHSQYWLGCCNISRTSVPF